MKPEELDIKKFNEGLRKKEFSAREVTQAFLSRIEEKDPEIGSYLSVSAEAALEQAGEVDEAVSRSETLGVLAGVPIAVKDVILVKGQPATAASRMLEHYTASYDADAVSKLRENKAVFLGKTNLDEFAMGSSTENSAFKATKNPHDTTRVPGGSSGGSAAAVAASLALASLGTDTGGSIRQPANYCGVVGLKPTYGAVSRSGLMAMASSLDQIGVFAKTAEDAALMFDGIKGKSAMDATSYPAEYDKELLNPSWDRIKNLTIGLPSEYFIDGIDPEVRESVEKAIARLKEAGIRFKEVSLPHTKYALSCYYIIMPAEVSSNLARFDGIRYSRNEHVGKEPSLLDIYLKQRGHGFGAEVKRRIILGTFVLSSGYYDAYYAKAQKVRSLIKHDFEIAFKDVDVMLTPVTPSPAFKIGEKVDDPLSMYLSDIFTLTANLAGIPGLAVPVENDWKGKLPVGFQLLGKPYREADILGIGRLYEKL